ncbi:hypothetical protein [Streptomyces sp. NPDC056632]|uniref:hypothetical protein n=1 Tax=Streptomyces sp. NPDC056632 TaxID=3345884 RepID=UPI003678BF6E
MVAEQGTITVEPADVAAFGEFLQVCAGQGTDGNDALWGVESLLDLLEFVVVNPGDPAVLPGAQSILEALSAILKPLYEGLMVFGQGIKNLGEELVKVAEGFADAEEMAAAGVKDLGNMLAITNEFMKDSGGTMASLSQMAKENAPTQTPSPEKQPAQTY